MACNPSFDRPPSPPSRGGVGAFAVLGSDVRAYAVELAPRRIGYPDRHGAIRRRSRVAISPVALLLFLLLLPLLLRLGCCLSSPQLTGRFVLSGISGWFPLLLLFVLDRAPLLLKGRPVRRCRASSAPTRAMAGQPTPEPVHSRRPSTDRAGGTSLYRFAAILPRTAHLRGRSRPEELIPPPPPPTGGELNLRHRRPATRKAGSCAALRLLRSRAFRLPAVSATRSSATGGVRCRSWTPGRAPTTRAAWLGQHLGTRPSGLVWPACQAMAGSPAPSPTSARRPVPVELILPPAPRWGGCGSSSLDRSTLVAPGSPAFGRSFTPPPLRSVSVHSLPLSGRPSAPTASLPRSRRAEASCRRGAGIPARAGASLAGILPYLPAGVLPAPGNGAWVPHLPARVPRPPPSGTAPARFRKLHLAGLRRPAPVAGLGRSPWVMSRPPPAPRQPSAGSRLRRLRRHPSAVRHSASVMWGVSALPPAVPTRSAPLAALRGATLARSLRAEPSMARRAGVHPSPWPAARLVARQWRPPSHRSQ